MHYSVGGFDDFAALVLAAMGADAVRHFRFVAVRALGVRGFAQGVVGAAVLRACVGVSSFGFGIAISLLFRSYSLNV